MLSRVIIWGCSVVLAISFVTNCATTSIEKTEHAPVIKPEPLPAPPPGLHLKAYHHDMCEEMQKSYERADKIITDNTPYWNLIDIYPVTEECNAKAVFNWMMRDQN